MVENNFEYKFGGEAKDYHSIKGHASNYQNLLWFKSFPTETTLRRFHFSCSLWVSNYIKSVSLPICSQPNQRPLLWCSKSVCSFQYIQSLHYSAHTYPQIRESPMCASTVFHYRCTIACEIVQISAKDHGSRFDQSFTSKILCFLSKLQIKRLEIGLVIKMISHSGRLSQKLNFEPSNSKRMPLNEGLIFETLSRAQNSMHHLICRNGSSF